ncbi:MAG TPA: class I SAM-dependent methyltransferase [Planctomycetota bacterium]|nr:class I SAM-dependent methyltransferase [Planctomycetota bacterium]HRR80684.1 class I SAM-dependent methyltransferase [Planctomycetota bacterium]HRT93272.1 class I SAM-dependent methyltransferase [Planctomycetota bacterium]
MGRETRESIVAETIRGKNVLDVGCIGRDADREANPAWLHHIVRKHARRVIGLDKDERGVQALCRKGYSILHGDAEMVTLGEEFDCIVAGEVIEHLSNPGLFLRNMKRHLVPGGALILTTPNAFYPKLVWEVLRYGRVSLNHEHTCWYCPGTLRHLLSREGFTEVAMHYVTDSTRYWGLGRLPGYLRQWFCKTLVVVARAGVR